MGTPTKTKRHEHQSASRELCMAHSGVTARGDYAYCYLVKCACGATRHDAIDTRTRQEG